MPKAKQKADHLTSVASLVGAELEAIFSRCDDEIDGIREELRGDNEDVIKAIDWSQVTDVLSLPEVRDLMLAHIQSVIDHLTYMND